MDIQTVKGVQNGNGRVLHEHHHHPRSTTSTAQNDNSPAHSGESAHFDMEQSPRTIASEPKTSRRSSQDLQKSLSSVPGANHELSPTIWLQERRKMHDTHSERGTVSTNALQRQIKREQQLVQDHEQELNKLRKGERKSKFSSFQFPTSGIARSFSDAKLEDMEMKESSSRQNDTDSEVVRMLKERLDDSEKDRREAEAIFNQRISTLLRERNVQRVQMQSAEETIMKLNGETEALKQTNYEFRRQIETSSTGSPVNNNQLTLLQRDNQQLREELDALYKEKQKLLDDLEGLSEELTLKRANERQNTENDHLAADMKNRIDTLRNQLSSLERNNSDKVTHDNGRFLSREGSFDGQSSNQTTPRNSGALRQAQLEQQLIRNQQELEQSHKKLLRVLEMSQRYETHCFKLEKELHKVYGNNYQFVQTDWRHKDLDLINNLKQATRSIPKAEIHPKKIASISVATQTIPATQTSNVRSERDELMDKLTDKVNGMVRMLEKISPDDSPTSSRRKSASEGRAVASAFDDLLRAIREGQTSSSVDLTKLTEAKLEIQSLHKSFRFLEEKNVILEKEIQRLYQLNEDTDRVSQNGSIDSSRPITQEEIDDRIMKAQLRSAQLHAAGLLPMFPPVGVTNPFVTNDSPGSNYTSNTSGVWELPWSPGVPDENLARTTPLRPRASTLF